MYKIICHNQNYYRFVSVQDTPDSPPFVSLLDDDSTFSSDDDDSPEDDESSVLSESDNSTENEEKAQTLLDLPRPK